jgi:hypothetical protein
VSLSLPLSLPFLAAINRAEHYIYIENQFFVTSAADPLPGDPAADEATAAAAPAATAGGGPVQNRIGYALYRRIRRAAAEGKPFRVLVLLPLLPAFSGTSSLWSCSWFGSRAFV